MRALIFNCFKILIWIRFKINVFGARGLELLYQGIMILVTSGFWIWSQYCVDFLSSLMPEGVLVLLICKVYGEGCNFSRFWLCCIVIWHCEDSAMVVVSLNDFSPVWLNERMFCFYFPREWHGNACSMRNDVARNVTNVLFCLREIFGKKLFLWRSLWLKWRRQDKCWMNFLIW